MKQIVKEIQELIGVDVDGLHGLKTELAHFNYEAKINIDNMIKEK